MQSRQLCHRLKNLPRPRNSENTLGHDGVKYQPLWLAQLINVLQLPTTLTPYYHTDYQCSNWTLIASTICSIFWHRLSKDSIGGHLRLLRPKTVNHNLQLTSSSSSKSADSTSLSYERHARLLLRLVLPTTAIIAARNVRDQAEIMRKRHALSTCQNP